MKIEKTKSESEVKVRSRTENKTIVVTGGARGIGKAILRHQATLGANLVVSDLVAADCEATACELQEQYGVATLPVACDVRKRDHLQNLIDTTLQKFGGIDIWVNNAGVKHDNLLIRMKEEEWDNVFDTNVKAAFIATQLVAKPMMKKRSGRIINIGSVSGFYGNGGQVNYSASKAALHTITKSAARELAPRNITVNCLVAGFVDNEFAADVPEAIKDNLLGSILLQAADPELEIAKAVSFFASDDAGFITGALLRVDGGMAVGF